MFDRVHLPADDQSPRWVGPVWFAGDPNVDPDLRPCPDRHGWVITRCGQPLCKALDMERITTALDQADCRRCLHSYGAVHLGLAGRDRRARRVE